MALDRLGVEYDLVGWSEIDKYAIKAHNLLYPQYTEHNYGNICNINWSNVPDFDLFTMSSPCQDFSSAGMSRGGAEDSGTRSSLLWECCRAIVEKRPKYIVFENVKNLVSKKFLPDFLKWQNELSNLGYTNFSQVLNAKDYGVAQNRERVFMVSILGDAWYDFPQKQRLTKCIADYLDDNAGAKYYLSEKIKLFLGKTSGKDGGFGPMKCRNLKSIARTINSRTSKMGKQDNYIIQLNPCTESGGVQPYQQNRVYDTKGISPTIGTTNPGNIVSCALRGRPTIDSNNAQQIEFNNSLFVNSNTTVQKDSMLSINDKIRRLTPRECFRLMDVLDSDFDKLNGLSDARLYQLAGNSIVVACLVGIFKNLLTASKKNT